jgi:hypothetical protein
MTKMFEADSDGAWSRRSSVRDGRPRTRAMPRHSPVPVLLLLAAALVYLAVTNPTTPHPHLLGGCTWYTLFHINGPLCGGTRMVWYLMRGDVIDAARMHLVALAGSPVAIYLLARWSLNWWRGITLPWRPLPRWVYLGYAIVFVIYGAVLRNLPAFWWFHIQYMQSGIGM